MALLVVAQRLRKLDFPVKASEEPSIPGVDKNLFLRPRVPGEDTGKAQRDRAARVASEEAVEAAQLRGTNAAKGPACQLHVNTRDTLAQLETAELVHFPQSRE